ncbi:MAG: hypothetical protein V3T86_07405 [Planctomycetota bacterium]
MSQKFAGRRQDDEHRKRIRNLLPPLMALAVRPLRTDDRLIGSRSTKSSRM